MTAPSTRQETDFDGHQAISGLALAGLLFPLAPLVGVLIGLIGELRSGDAAAGSGSPKSRS